MTPQNERDNLLVLVIPFASLISLLIVAIVERNISYFPHRQEFWQLTVAFFLCFMLLNIGLHCISLYSFKNGPQMERELTTLLLIVLLAVAYMVLSPIIPAQQISHAQQRVLVVFLVSVLIIIWARLPISAGLILIGGIVIKTKKEEAIILLFSSWWSRFFLFQTWLIFLRADSILKIPWWILLFQAPIIFVVSVVIFFLIINQMLRCVQTRQHRAYQRKEIFAFANIILLLICVCFFCFNIFNWVAVEVHLSCVNEVGIGFSFLHLLFCVFFRKQILYSLVSQPFKIFYRVSQNTFSDKFYPNINSKSIWSMEVCNKCCQRPADVILSRCFHFCVCSQCAVKHRSCLICTEEFPAQRIIWSSHYEDEVFKIRFYRQNQFKVVPLP